MRIITKLNEIGFCYGVKRAIKIAKETIDNPNTIKPVYLLGNLVHNHHINEYLSSLGIIILDKGTRLEMLDEIDFGTVIFTAHGVSNKVIEKAKNKNLNIVDATCPYVEETFKQMKEKADDGYDILFVGKSNHPESEAALSLSDKVHIVTKEFKPISLNKPLLCHQTTMSSYDIEKTIDKLKQIYPSLSKMNMICKVTEKRQQAILALKNHHFITPSIIIIIGDKTSNNSNKLYEMAKRLNKTDVLFIDNINELDFFDLKKYNEIIIGSGTSTPEAITNELYELLLNLDNIKKNNINSKLSLNDYTK